MSLPKSLPQTLVPLSCFAAAPPASGLEGCPPLPAAMEDSWVCFRSPVSCCRQWRSHCLSRPLSSQHGGGQDKLAPLAPAVGLAQHGSVRFHRHCSTRPNIASCLGPRQGRGGRGEPRCRPSPAQSRRWAEEGHGAEQGRLPLLPKLPSQNYRDSEQGSLPHPPYVWDKGC